MWRILPSLSGGMNSRPAQRNHRLFRDQRHDEPTAHHRHHFQRLAKRPRSIPNRPCRARASSQPRTPDDRPRMIHDRVEYRAARDDTNARSFDEPLAARCSGICQFSETYSGTIPVKLRIVRLFIVVFRSAKERENTIFAERNATIMCCVFLTNVRRSESRSGYGTTWRNNRSPQASYRCEIQDCESPASR